jgi:hypothetical protein
MAVTGSAVNLSSLLLEKNRSNGKGPSLLVSEWVEEAGEAGFAGIEIWINHLLFSSRSEWELIRDRSGDADLPISAITAALPSDGSDKSQRFRDSLIEACDYFRPESLKLGLADIASENALGFLKEWSRDVPREAVLWVDGGEATTPAALAKARGALDGRIRGVLRPFLMAPAELAAAFDAGGDFIANFGVQPKRGQPAGLLEENAEASRKIIALARARGFKGSWTLESAKGAGLPGENIERLFDNAERDLNFLIEAQAMAALAR